MRRILIALFAVLILVAAGGGWLMKSESGLRWAWRTAGPWLPAGLEAARVSGVLAGPVELTGVAFEDGGLVLTGERAELDWNPWALAALTLDIDRLRVEGLRISLPPPAPDSQTASSPLTAVEIKLPLKLRLDDLEVEGIDVTRGDSAWRMERLGLTLYADGDRFEIAHLQLDSELLDASLNGQVATGAAYAHRIEFEWKTVLASGADLGGGGRFDGNLSATRLEHRLEGAIRMRQTIELEDLLGALRWRSRIDVERFETRLLDANLPDLEGSLGADLEGDLETWGASGTLSSVLPRLGSVSADFELRNLEGERRFDGMWVEKFVLHALDGDIGARGEVAWTPVPSWDAEISLRGIDPAGLDGAWPGRLNGNLTTRGAYPAESLTVTAGIDRLDGELRGYPVAARGSVEWRRQGLSIEALEIDSGGTRLSASGRADEALDLDWALHSGDLAEVYPDARGSLDLEGKVRGTREAPQVEAGVAGEALAYADYQVGRIGGRLAIEPLRPDRFDIDLAAEDIRIRLREFGRITVKAGPQRIDARLSNDLSETHMVLEGGLDGPAWRGTLAGLTVETREFSNWKLSEPAALELSLEYSSLARSCLLGERRGRVCSAWSGNESDWNLELDIEKLPLQLLSNRIPRELSLKEGVLTAQADLQKREGAPLTGKIKIDIDSGAAQYRLASGKTLNLAYREVDLDLAPGPDGIGVDGRLLLENGDYLELAGQLPGTYLLDLGEGFRDLRATLRGRLSGLDNIDALIPQVDRLAGRLELDLQVGGSLEQPTISGYASLGDARMDIPDADLSLAGVNLVAEADGSHGIVYRATARALGGEIEASGDFRLDPARGWALRDLRARLRGRISELEKIDALIPQIDNLAGRLEFDFEIGGDLDRPQISGNASLGDARLDIADVDLSLTDVSLVAQADGGRGIDYRATARAMDGEIEASGDIRLDPDGGWPGSVALRARNFVPLGFMSLWLPEEVVIDGRFDGNANLQFGATIGLRGEVEIVSARGRILYPLLEGELDSLDYHDAGARVVADETGISGESRISTEEGISFAGRFELPGARLLDLDPQNQALKGNARLEVQELQLLQLLSFDIERPQGSYELDVEASGTLARPRLAAQARLTGGEVGIPRLGIRLKGISMTGTTQENNRFDFVIDARSGEGSVQITGSSVLDSASGWPTRISIKGENFETARIPEATIVTSPDLVLQLEHRSIDISGDLYIPFARIEPRDLTTAQQVSNDTVIVGQEQAEESKWRITTRINLVLGERVTLYGFGFEGRLAGRLQVEEEPGKPTTGTGEIAIPEGRYRAYGQRLDIENGRVLFTGGPVANPGLDIRATRTSGSVISGLQISGRLQQPRIELFSIPAMGQTDILSYLLFGRPMETASGEDSAMMAQAALALGLAGGDRIARSLRERFGLDDFRVEADDTGDQASLVIGRYLSSDVYVSYGVGLIESVNSLNLRYRISERWQLEAESGTYHGADILYTIER
jgi:autotransporter translocation and assembly factor TamB